ncbi:hypothetical protein [Gordonibacter sp.]|uniref:hypothetical protein n=1 Tax=Gordonibacter sp. TaxID=1968902 RepID=UPI002FC887F8
MMSVGKATMIGELPMAIEVMTPRMKNPTACTLNDLLPAISKRSYTKTVLIVSPLSAWGREGCGLLVAVLSALVAALGILS